MIIFNTFILSLIICIDSFLLCLLSKYKEKKTYIWIPLIFALFQIIFLLTGYLIGDFLELYFNKYLKYLVFIIFSTMGIKLVVDTLINKGKEEITAFSTKDIIIQAVITSIDSLFIGIPLALNSESYLIFTLIIGLTTYFVCLLGLLIKNKISSRFEDKIGISGAIILFIFAIKSLL